MKNKNKWIATILNIIPGLGYLYLGKRKVFSYLFLLAILIGVIDSFFNPWPETHYTLLSFIGTMAIIFAFMYDAFKENNDMSVKKKNDKKNTWLAAILNIIPGLGYL